MSDLTPTVIDAHTHAFPPEIGANREAFRQRDAWFADLYANPKASLATAEDLIESMDRAGIDKALICGFPWRDAGLCTYHNDYMQDATRRYPERLSWLGIVASSMGKDLAVVAETLLMAGARGLGELNADAQGIDLLAGTELDAAVQVCVKKNAPVMLHASEPVGHSYPGKGSATPDRLVRFALRYPELRIVLAHWGGGLPFYELMPEVRSALGNVVYDTAASTYLYDFMVFRRVIDIAGAQKVLFGSDYPILRQDRFLNRVLSLQWDSQDELKQVLSDNARRTYGLLPKGPEST
ncbi:MAG: amidohydrolase family protein [Thermomicrobiales bacterium]